MSYVDKLKANIDWKRKSMHIYLDDINGTAIKLEINEEGYCDLESVWFKTIEVTNKLQGFIEALKEYVSKDQLESILCLWGTSNAIKASNMTEVLQDKLLTKKIIGLGLLKKIITGGVNSTYKVINKEEQKTMAEIAAKMEKGERVQVNEPSMIETGARLRHQGIIGQPIVLEEEVIEEEIVEEEKEFQTMTRYVRPVEEKVAKQVKSVKQAVTIIAEKKDHSSMSEGDLRREFKALQHELEVDKWGEDRTPWAVNDEIQLVKAQLNGFENRRNAEKYKKEVNSLSPIVPEKKGVQGKSQILPKKKPLQALTPVVKKRS